MNRLVVILMSTLPLQGLVIKVDYRYDTQGFFDDPQARVVIEAAAARWSRIVDQTLQPVNMTDGAFVDGRFQLIHPATGNRFIVSAAASRSSDFTFSSGQGEADQYLGGFTLAEDEWILFVGARVLTEAARGGPMEGGQNLNMVFDDPDSFLNRGFNVGRDSLAVIGGYISFDFDRLWNFDLGGTGVPGSVDFYSVALHEIGHGLGLNSRSVAEWGDLLNGDNFIGANAIAAYEADNDQVVTGLEISNSSADDYHWKDDKYDSKIFPLGMPLLVETVGLDNLQDLLMEPAFNSAAASRIEVTNVDAAALRDLGWSLITQDPPRPADLPVVVLKPPTGGAGFEIASEVGKVYSVQTSIDGVSWANVIPSLVGDGSTLSWVDGQVGFTDPFGPASTRKEKFYRIVKEN